MIPFTEKPHFELRQLPPAPPKPMIPFTEKPQFDLRKAQTHHRSSKCVKHGDPTAFRSTAETNRTSKMKAVRCRKNYSQSFNFQDIAMSSFRGTTSFMQTRILEISFFE
ncbi:hypothetical protein LR48_Vigan04g009000 [Vigna angularis]|uniref:Uncharacterized protein n=1 Tax=Phaseolus angularis TaxID=3914 RepID=A0A0L9UBF8_PHAAN|nr:hypothetical protein LR48_Vigan04g009000 [Vigna angularis]